MPSAPSERSGFGPDYQGRGLVNLVAELERRLTGSGLIPGLAPDLSDRVPDRPTYVLVLFDGLGSGQLGHPAAKTLAGSHAGDLDAPYPTTTTVSLATLVTGTVPASHGVIGHYMFVPEIGDVVNILKWVTPTGTRVEYPTGGFLPRPNLWERLRQRGIEPITVQPADFERSPLTAMLYRGCRFESAGSVEEAVAAVAAVATVPGRLILAYVPDVDYAAHVWGQRSDAYASALARADTVWSRLAAVIPAGAALVGTADHGLIDYPETAKVLIRDHRYRRLMFFGDARTVLLRGAGEVIGELAAETGAELIGLDRLRRWWGAHPGVEVHPDLGSRSPDAGLLAPPGSVLLPPGFDKRLIGYHGGIEPGERVIPLLVRQAGPDQSR